MGELIFYYNPISLISVMVWTASARYIFFFYFSLLNFILYYIVYRYALILIKIGRECGNQAYCWYNPPMQFVCFVVINISQQS